MESLLTTSNHAKAATQLGNLSATMGDLANALSGAGRHQEALEVAEKGVAIRKTQGDHRNTASGYGRCASILVAAGRYDEADARYELALAAARQAGDRELEGTTLQHQGSLADERNQLDRATRLYQQALQRFQESGDTEGVMQTYNLLGVAERKGGRLAEARAWYGKSRELAVQLKDQRSLGAAAQNIGIVCQEEGKVARAQGGEVAARRHFEEARSSVEESLRIWQAQQNRPREADSLSQLARIHLLLGDLAAAERHAHAAREIRESLGLKEAHHTYHTLSEIATAREDTAAATEWARKRDELRAELERRAGGGGGIPAQLLQALQSLTMACARAGFGGETLDPGAEEALAKLDGFDAPLPDFSASLRRLAAGEFPSIPANLPRELHEILDGITKAIRDQTP